MPAIGIFDSGYGGLTILGVEGYQRLKDWLKRKKRQPRP
jgi:glutamate racemase